ncbi:hypothetical protein [Arcicella lustrica]|uniref:Uncharacterized protein n=1 Tax=Arcicella lustrica TaxID=2984196 RepID=A0ABU5SHQ2_9BACT|nr:hypothetical protein [Arcicella sp. DC25W]MEA5426818.1 hypothetical protein [Arcicella sp. DC25W]
MQIEMPIFDECANIVDYIPMSVEFPHCIKKSNFLYTQYKMIDESTCYEITLFRNGQIQLYKVDHDKANETVTETSKLLGFRFWRFGFQKHEFQACELKEVIENITGSWMFFNDLFAKYMI